MPRNVFQSKIPLVVFALLLLLSASSDAKGGRGRSKTRSKSSTSYFPSSHPGSEGREGRVILYSVLVVFIALSLVLIYCCYTQNRSTGSPTTQQTLLNAAFFSRSSSRRCPGIANRQGLMVVTDRNGQNQSGNVGSSSPQVALLLLGMTQFASEHSRRCIGDNRHDSDWESSDTDSSLRETEKNSYESQSRGSLKDCESMS